MASTCHCTAIRLSQLIALLTFAIISLQQLLTTLIYMARKGQE